MLKFGNKEFRNLQEQVFKNMKDIQDIMDGTTVLAEFGIKVIGQVESAAQLPDPNTYTGEFGDAYVVGSGEPYDYYINSQQQNIFCKTICRRSWLQFYAY